MNTNNTGNVNFPDYIQKQLNAAPPGPSGRHEAWKDLSFQMVGERIPDDVIFRVLREWIIDPDKTDAELRDCIKGAHARNPQPAARSGKGHSSQYEYNGDRPRTTLIPKVKRFQHDVAHAAEEIPSLDLSTSEFLQRKFRPGDTVCITKTAELRDDKWIPAAKGTFKPREWWLEEMSERPEFFNGEPGAWIRMNPFKADLYNGTDADVIDFRHVLVEFDKLPKLEQWHVIKSCGLPIACVIDSAGKSLHAWVKVDAADATEYKARQELVYDYLGNVMDDVGNKNPSRWSRLPGALRDGRKQKLIALDIGAKSFEEWEAGVYDDGLPETLDLADFLEIEIEEPKHLLQGLMRVGQVCSLAGAMKTNKSWTMMEIAQGIACGSKFLKWEANVNKIFYIDTELDRYDFQYRHGLISAQTKLEIDRGDFAFKLLRGTCISIDNLVPAIMREIRGKGYGLICLDSIYSLLGDREENSNEDISHLGRLLLHLAFELNVGVLFSHHFSKGKQDGKRGIEKSSGAGAWGRFVDNGIAIDQHPQEGCYNIEPEYRTFAKQPSFVAQRVNGLWRVREDLKIEAKTTANQAASLTDILRVLEGEELPVGEWKDRCTKTLSMRPRTFDNRKKDAKALIEEKKSGKELMCKLKSSVVFNEEKCIYEIKKTDEPF